MNVDLTVNEAQSLLDSINVLIREKRRDTKFFDSMLVEGPGKDRVMFTLAIELEVAENARRKVQAVA